MTLLARHAPTACHKCGVELALGDECAVQKNGCKAGRHGKIYHKTCYEGTFIGE
jgi:hypothetical protein